MARLPVRTSVTHPLRIAQMPAGESGGLLGITFCPGKQGPSFGGFVWERDLGLDLDAIAAWQAAAVVTLIEDHEFELLRVPDLGSQLRARGIEWHHIPIVDVQPPDERFERAWVGSGPRLHEHLTAGRRVLVHCRGGLGRAGTVAARLLVELGVPAMDAIDKVRRVREGAIETRAQERYVLSLPTPVLTKPRPISAAARAGKSEAG